MGKAVGYVRTPHDKDSDHSVGLDGQTEQITLWCQENGYQLDDIHMDAHGRKGLARMVDTMQEDTVLVVESLAVLGGTADEMIDLFGRLHSTHANLVLIREGIDTSSASGQITTRLLEAFFRLGSARETESPDTAPPQADLHDGMASPTYVIPEEAKDKKPDPQDDEDAPKADAVEEREPEVEAVADADPPAVDDKKPDPQDDHLRDAHKVDVDEEPVPEKMELATPVVGGYSEIGVSLDADGKYPKATQNNPFMREIKGTDSTRKRRKSDYVNVAEAANRCVQNGEHRKAIALWREYLDATDEDNAGMALNAIGDIFVKINRPIEAIDYLFRASRAFEESGFYPKAVAALKKVLKLNPRQNEVHLQLATLAARCDRLGDAVESYLKFAHHLMESGLKTEAISVFEKIRILDPVNARHRLQLAEELLEFGFTDEAVEETCYAADMLIDQGNAEDAERHLSRLLDVAPGRTDILERIDLAVAAKKAPVQESAQKVDEGDMVFVTDTDLDRDSDSFWIRPLGSDID